MGRSFAAHVIFDFGAEITAERILHAIHLCAKAHRVLAALGLNLDDWEVEQALGIHPVINRIKSPKVAAKLYLDSKHCRDCGFLMSLFVKSLKLCKDWDDINHVYYKLHSVSNDFEKMLIVMRFIELCETPNQAVDAFQKTIEIRRTTEGHYAEMVLIQKAAGLVAAEQQSKRQKPQARPDETRAVSSHKMKGQ